MESFRDELVGPGVTDWRSERKLTNTNTAPMPYIISIRA